MPRRIWQPIGLAILLLGNLAGHAQDKATVPTEIRLRNLQAQVQSVTKQLASIDAKTPALEKRLKELIEKVHSVQKPPALKEEKVEEEPKLQPMKVEYRPPLFVLKKNEERPIVYVCKDAKVFVLNQSTVRSAIQGRKVAKGDLLQMTTGDFDLLVDEAVFFIKFEAKLRPNKTGESLERISQADSEFMKHLKPLNANRDKVIFLVFPDSYEAFRAARALVWRQGMTMEWYPRGAGENIRL